MKFFYIYNKNTKLPTSTWPNNMRRIRSWDNTIVDSDSEPQALIFLVGPVGCVFCSEEIHSHTSLYRRNSDRNIEEMIGQIKNQVKQTEKNRVKAIKEKKIKKIQIASWSRADIQKLKQLLKVFGTDFQSIAIAMNKTRDQVKRKYKVLQKKSDEVLDCVFEKQIRFNRQKPVQSEFQ